MVGRFGRRRRTHRSLGAVDDVGLVRKGADDGRQRSEVVDRARGTANDHDRPVSEFVQDREPRVLDSLAEFSSTAEDDVHRAPAGRRVVPDCGPDAAEKDASADPLQYRSPRAIGLPNHASINIIL